jgi:threonine/homoserine/homoserine lactone efflux protein
MASMTLATFVFAVLALLLAPGPTNTLMAVAGAERGVRHVLRLLPAELAGYLTTVLPLAYLGAQVIAAAPALAVALKLAAAIWVMVLAVRLWRATPGDAAAGGVGARRIYVTTLLNPKALVFGLALLPAPHDPEFALRLGLFCLMVSGAATLWGCAGALTRAGQGGARRLVFVRRLASAWLGFVSISLVVDVLRA